MKNIGLLFIQGKKKCTDYEVKINNSENIIFKVAVSNFFFKEQ